MKPIDFILKYGNAVKNACKGTGVFPSVCLAQAALETGWGKASIDNNMFGIKAKGPHTEYWKGDYKTVLTTEYVKGAAHKVYSAFRTYPTVEDSIRDHNAFLHTNRRYAKALKAETPEEQCRLLKEAGYATAPKYAETLISIINTHNLKQFDL